MLTIYMASNKSRDTSCNSTGIQDGGQNSKWLRTVYNVVYISFSLRYTICIHIKIYAIRTDNSNIWILSGKKIKMAAKIQNVCHKLTDFTHQRFRSEQVWSISWYQQEFSRICAQYNNTAKKSWDTCPTNTGIQDGRQNSKRLPAMLSISPCISMTKLIFMWKCVWYETYVDIKFKYMNSEWKENQDGRQNSKCLSKIDRFYSSKISFRTSVINIWIPAEIFQNIYVRNIIIQRKIHGTRVQLLPESKMVVKTQNGCRQCCLYLHV